MWMKRQKNLREHIINEKPNTKAIKTTMGKTE